MTSQPQTVTVAKPSLEHHREPFVVDRADRPAKPTSGWLRNRGLEGRSNRMRRMHWHHRFCVSAVVVRAVTISRARAFACFGEGGFEFGLNLEPPACVLVLHHGGTT
jgi:hypothetical protein